MMIGKVSHVCRRLNGENVTVSRLGTIYNGKLIILWPESIPLHTFLQIIMGLTTGADPTLAGSDRLDSSNSILISPKAMLELAPSDALSTSTSIGLAPNHEPTLLSVESDELMAVIGPASIAKTRLEDILKSSSDPILSIATKVVTVLRAIEEGSTASVLSPNVDLVQLLGSVNAGDIKEASTLIANSDCVPMPVEKGDFTGTQPVTINTFPRLAVVFDSAVNENPPVIVTGDPILADAAEAEHNVLGPPLLINTPLVCESIQPKYIGVSPFIQNGEPVVADTYELNTKAPIPLVIVAAPVYPLGFYTGYNAIVPAISDAFPRAMDALESTIRDPLPVVTKGEVKTVDAHEIVDVATVPATLHTAALSADAVCNEGMNTPSSTFLGTPTMGDSAELSNSNTTSLVFDGAPTISATFEANDASTLASTFLGTPTVTDVLEAESMGVGQLFQDGFVEIIDVDHINLIQQMGFVTAVIPHYQTGVDGEVRASSPMAIKLDISLTPSQIEGSNKPILYLLPTRCDHSQSEIREGLSDDFAPTTIVLYPMLRTAKNATLDDTMSSIINVTPNLTTVVDIAANEITTTVIRSECMLSGSVGVDNTSTTPFVLEGISRTANAVDGESHTICSVFASSDLRTIDSIETGNMSTSPASQISESGIVDIEEIGGKQSIALTVAVVSHTPVATDDGQVEVAPPLVNHASLVLTSIQSAGHDRPISYIVPIYCGYDRCLTQDDLTTNFEAVTTVATIDQITSHEQSVDVISGVETSLTSSFIPGTEIYASASSPTTTSALHVDQVGAYDMNSVNVSVAEVATDIFYSGSVKFCNQNIVNGILDLSTSMLDTLDISDGSSCGGVVEIESRLRDLEPMSFANATSLSTDAKPVIRLPIETSCGVAACGSSCMYHAAYLEVAGLDNAHVTTIDILSMSEFDAYHVMCDDEQCCAAKRIPIK